MKSFEFNRQQSELLKVLKAKAEKQNLEVISTENQIQIFLKVDEFKNGEADIPVNFKGKFSEEHGKTILRGKFSYGFYLYTMVFVALLLIAARFSWSAYKGQVDNMILCGIVTLILSIVMVIVNNKSKKAKIVIEDFLKNLNKK